VTLEEIGGTGADLSNSVIRSVKGVETNPNTINQHLTCKAPCPFDECSGGPRPAHAALGDGSAQRDQRHQSLPDGNYSKIERYGFPSLAILWVQDRFLASAKFRRLTVRDQLAQANWGVRGVVKRDKMAEGKYKLLCSRFVFARPEDVNGSRWLDLYRFSVLPRHSL